MATYVIDLDWSWLLDVGPAWLMSVHPEWSETFLWLDFVMIVGFMSSFMLALALAVVLGGLTAAAMGSLIIRLGSMLFESIRATPLGLTGEQGAKAVLFLAGAIWSVWLGDRILKRQGVPANRRWVPLIPGVLGSTVVGIAWWPAIFGL